MPTTTTSRAAAARAGRGRPGARARAPPRGRRLARRASRTIEMPLVPVLARMERVGVGLDTSVLAGLAAELRAASTRCAPRSSSSRAASSSSTRPSSSARCSSSKLGLPHEQEDQDRLLDRRVGARRRSRPVHPIAEKIVEYRELTKLKSTYIDALPRLLGEDGRLHTSFNQTVAATGRLSSSNPNLQNIPVRTEFGRRIRAAFVPAERGRRDGLGRLQPDRAADPRAPLGRRGAHRGVHERRWTSTRPRRRASSASTPDAGRAGHARAGEGGQLRHRVRAVARTGSPRRSRSRTPRRRR